MAGWVFLRPLSLAAGGCLLAVSSDGPSSVRDLWGAPGVPLRVPVSSAYKDAGASQLALVVKNPSANAGDVGDAGSIPGSGRSPGEGHGNPFQYSCLENPLARGAQWATDHTVVKSRTRLKRLSTRAHTPHGIFKTLILLLMGFVCLQIDFSGHALWHEKS